VRGKILEQMTYKHIISTLEKVCKGLVKHPDSVSIKAFVIGHKIIASVKCAETDAGKIIGAGGANIKAIGNIGQAMADSVQMRLIISVDVGEQSKECFYKFAANPAYDCTEEAQLLEEIGATIFNDGVKVSVINEEMVTALIMSYDGEQDEQLGEDLNTVFSAIGKNKGANLLCELDAR
jgi:predicted RNA-binding protein YlqC (UPF0109 family)